MIVIVWVNLGSLKNVSTNTINSNRPWWPSGLDNTVSLRPQQQEVCTVSSNVLLFNNNGKIKLLWQNISHPSFKIKCKKLFMAN